MGGESPNGFLLCDGSKVSRKTYADLFDVIGTRFGSGDGVSTFSLPNLSDKVARGTTDALHIGDVGGNDEVILSVENLPSHTHGLGSHSHTVTPSGSVSSSFSGNNISGTFTTPQVRGNGCFSTSGTGMVWGASYSSDADTECRFSATPSGSVKSTFSGDSNTTSDASGNTDSTGESDSFSIIPSYVNFYYIIKY